MTDAQREANAKRRAREIRQAHRKFRRKEIAVAAFSSFYAMQSSAQTVTLPASGTATVVTRTPGLVLGAGSYTLGSGTTGTVNLNNGTPGVDNNARQAVVIWNSGLGIATTQTLNFSNGNDAVVLNKILGTDSSVFNGAISTSAGSVKSLVFINPNGFNLSNLRIQSSALDTGFLFSTRDLGANVSNQASAQNLLTSGSFPSEYVNDARLGFGPPVGSSNANILISGGISNNTPQHFGVITDGGSVTISGAPVNAGFIYITSASGEISTTGSGKVAAGSGLTVSAGTGNVSISSSGTPVVELGGATVVITHADSNPLNLGNVTTTGNFTATSSAGFTRAASDSAIIVGGTA